MNHTHFADATIEPAPSGALALSLDHLPMAACLLDSTAAVVAANAAWHALLGCADCGGDWLSRMSSPDKAALLRWLSAPAEAASTPFAFCANGGSAVCERWLESTWARQLDGLLLLVFRDITFQRRFAQESEVTRRELDDARARLTQIFHAATDALLLIDCSTLEILDANPAAWLLYGYQADTLVGRSVAELSSDRGHMRKMIGVRQQRAPRRSHKRADGTRFPVEMFAHYFQRDGREVAVLSIRDITRRTQQERAQLESELKYRAVFDAAPYPIFVIDAAGEVCDANPVACELYGYARNEMLGLSSRGLIDDQGQVEAMFKARKTFIPASRHRRRDGSTFVAEITVSFMRVRNQIMAISVVRDITESLLTLERLQESEERWRFALEGAGDGVWDWNLVTNDFYQSPRWRQMLGYAPNDDSLRWNRLLHPADRNHVFGNLEAYLQGEAPLYEAEFRLRCADGTYKWIAARGKIMARDEQGRALRMLGTHRDIDDSRRMMEAVRASEERWQFALEGHGDGMWDWNLVTGKISVSRQFKHILGYDEDELEDVVSMLPFNHPDDRRRTADALNAHLTGNRPLFEMELRMRCKNGDYKWVVTRGKVMEYGALQRPVRMIGSLRDINELKLREQWERSQQEQLAHAGRLITMGEMASALAHELNQPLTAIRNFSVLGLRKLGDHAPEGIKGTLDIIAEQSLRAGQIVHRIRNFVRKGEGNFVEVSLDAVVADMARFAEIDAREHDVEIVLELAENLPLVNADRTGLEQVVMNLIKNGIEAMRGTADERILTITTRLREDRTIECSVSDAGVGLPDKLLGELFEPFVTTKADGMGLGLAICRSIIELHGGRLWAEPVTPHGASFHFTLPLEREQQEKQV